MTEKRELTVLDSFIINNPKNKRRRRNKIIVENESFELIYDVKQQEIQVAKKDDLYFSIIPYDTSRKYIETAVLMFIEKPEFLDEYLKKHTDNLKTYVKLALFQVTGKRFEDNSLEVLNELSYLETDIYFKIQVVGRLLQHDETGPLSATLPYKFLYHFNLKTGIHGYIKEWLIFLGETSKQVPFTLEGNRPMLLEEKSKEKINQEDYALVLAANMKGLTLRKSELSTTQLNELMTIRKDYKPQSKHPSEIAQYFDIVHPNKTDNLINVVSDIHSTTANIPIESPNFNIIAGDLVDGLSEVTVQNQDLKGIAVIGNHDIVRCAKAIGDSFSGELLKALTSTTDIDYSVIKVDDKKLYTTCKKYLESQFENLVFLNNESYEFQGVRYIGLSLPVSYVKERYLVQTILAKTLKKLLGKDKEMPTVIVSHAPLFNELSLLSKTSSSYVKEFTCVNQELETLFRDYHILGVIHGHHHIPASSGVLDFREFAGKEFFVLCSIYSSINMGFDLEPVLAQLIKRGK
ncbi:metallophosphoesterase family protein [Vagococcus fluvialis]|uniref:metallophosphoesterase family protein n=1 Tax=Vagococcus fluvialis TaxID=2738 RepID=UPI001432EA19|nr:metallophosphoesterase family protein [Vagococcus fluvialis]MBO0487971.1 metallophosphoesterase [Vagococcus fluvialis]NKC60847.1 metallophosphoesterase [Vagococcus fluvialis]NKD51732.1 metallophosphoesterase [Vagococcus fluvialis]